MSKHNPFEDTGIEDLPVRPPEPLGGPEGPFDYDDIPTVTPPYKQIPPGAQEGHDFEWDPPAALTAMRRWTCRTCGDAILARPDNTVYGAATERTCEESQVFWRS